MYFFIYFIKHLLRKYKYEKTYTKEKSQGFKDGQTIAITLRKIESK